MGVAFLTNWASPIGVTTKHSRTRVSWPIVDFVTLPVDIHSPRVLLVLFGEPSHENRCERFVERKDLRSDTVLTQKLIFVKHFF